MNIKRRKGKCPGELFSANNHFREDGVLNLTEQISIKPNLGANMFDAEQKRDVQNLGLAVE